MKPCRHCRKPFETRFSTLETCCSPTCALAYAKAASPTRLAADVRKARAVEKRERREAKQEIKSRKDWVREAQAVCNALVRERDYFQPCISCGDRIGPFDAGHFRSVGAAPELRYELLNIHKQCKECNSNTRRGGRYVMPVERAITIRESYRVNLVERIGLRQVEWLESYHEPLKPSVGWLREKMREWRADTRRMRERRGVRQAA